MQHYSNVVNCAPGTDRVQISAALLEWLRDVVA